MHLHFKRVCRIILSLSSVFLLSFSFSFVLSIKTGANRHQLPLTVEPALNLSSQNWKKGIVKFLVIVARHQIGDGWNGKSNPKMSSNSKFISTQIFSVGGRHSTLVTVQQPFFFVWKSVSLALNLNSKCFWPVFLLQQFFYLFLPVNDNK